MPDDQANSIPSLVDDPVDDVITTLRDDLLGGDGFLVVLLLTIAAVILIPIDGAFRGGAIVSTVVGALLVLTTLSRSRVSTKFRVIGGIIVGLSVTLALISVIRDIQPAITPPTGFNKLLVSVGSFSYCVVLALCFPAILRRTFAHRRVTLNTVAASLAAYLLLGLIFMSMYRFVNIVNGPFFVQPNVNGFTFEYFSFVTLTTVGFGDFTPATDAGRAVAMLEALIGQVFLVTIVALVVSNLGQGSSSLRGLTSPTTNAVGPNPEATIESSGETSTEPR